MGVVEGIQRNGHLRQGEIHSVECLDLLLRLFDLGLPIHSVKLRIVIMLLDVGGNVLEHGQRAIPIKAGDLLRPAVGGKRSNDENQGCYPRPH